MIALSTVQSFARSFPVIYKIGNVDIFVSAKFEKYDR